MRLFNILDTAFSSFDNTVRKYLQKTFENLGLNYTHNQIFGVIYDGIKGVMQNAMFYIEDALTEQNIYTATRKKSIYSLAKLSGYDPFYGSAASGVLTASTFVTSTAGQASTKIYIKDGTKVYNKSTGIVYTIMLPGDSYAFDVSRPLMKHELKIVQGTWQQSTFTASGNLFETFSVSSTSLFDREHIHVYVNGEEFSQAASIYDMTEGSKEFVLSVGFNSSFDVMLGNGTHGYCAQEGDVVVVKFIQHSGENGNISDPSSAAFFFESECYNGFGNTVNGDEYISLACTTLVSGGSESDSIEFVRKMIGFNSRSLVLASEDNFKLFLRRFSFIGHTNIFSEDNSLSITASCLANVDDKMTSPEQYLELDDKDFVLTDGQKEMVKTTLANSSKSFAGVTFNFEDPVIRKYAAICYVKVDDTYNKEAIKTAIRNSIAQYFIDLDTNTLFIPKSDIITRIMNENSSVIKSFDIDFISDMNEQSYHDGYHLQYKQRLVNGVSKYVGVKTMYDPESVAGLDDYGNIQLSSKLEMPLLHGGFKYYPNKESNDKTSSVRMETVQILFI